MPNTSTSLTAGEVMDRAAVLMNDAAKTDYNYPTLLPMLNMALDELQGVNSDSQSSGTMLTTNPILIPKGSLAMWPTESVNLPHYPADLIEVQEIMERAAGSNDKFIPLTRYEFHPVGDPSDTLAGWAWEQRIIKFRGPAGATTDREVRIKYFQYLLGQAFNEQTVIGTIDARAFLSYKTAAFAAMFIGENPERAKILDNAAEEAMERMTSIQNKGRQNIMTRHRPFRATYKARSGWY